MNERNELVSQALLRTVAWFDTIDYAPTWSECASWIEWRASSGFEHLAAPTGEELVRARDELIGAGLLAYAVGRIGFPDRLAPLSALSFERTTLFARKLRKALRVAKRLARFSSVRFIALVNTSAIAHARDAADLDFFVIVRDGRLWTVRLFAAGPYRVLGKLASADSKPDAICLSYFITDADCSLADHMLPGDDPYFRYWFLSMLPLYDDGIGQSLWDANKQILAQHPRAERWVLSPECSIKRPLLRFPDTAIVESFAKRVQMSWFPQRITETMNTDRSVIVSDRVMKFHVDDARLRFREQYEARVVSLGI